MLGRTPDQKRKGGLKRHQQQKWTKATSTAKVDRSDVNNKGGHKGRQQQSITVSPQSSATNAQADKYI
ncbi:hypothetical protein ElyMa_001034200 [Elysia marginata]|uniref:Uncharacterized protein n=1 Tax=Elysia marginata TaxID=1093978 RepID=A0AAV4HMT4_9GAST|nr:hypothetical protein ElyMa_001034200 [Elysia marginata]